MTWLLAALLLGAPGETWGSRHFVVRAEPGTLSSSQAEGFLRQLEAAHTAVARELGATVSPTRRSQRFDVIVCRDTASFARRSGRAWHHGAAASRGRLYTQPWGLMQRYRSLDATLRHEIVHLLLDDSLAGAPRWFVEGLAMVEAGDRPAGPGFVGPLTANILTEVDKRLASSKTREESEDAYRKAYAAVSRIAAHVGHAELRNRLRVITSQGLGALGPLEPLLAVPASN